MYILARGRTRYFYDTPDGNRILLMWLTAGELIGGAALSPQPKDYLLSVEAVRESTVLCWDRGTIRELVHRHPQMIDNCLSVAFDYLAWYVGAHLALSSQKAPERLAYTLHGLTMSIGEPVNGGLELDVTNEELANAAHISQYTASRLLSDWQKRGLLRKRRGKLFLGSAERFFAEMQGPFANA